MDKTASYTVHSHVFSAPPLAAGLYLVSTPIGNLSDITLRALETLAASSVIACEDTRTSGVLLQRYGINRPKVSYNEHNADQRGPDLLRQIRQGAVIALISDAGTPLVSDPGSRLVQEALAQGVDVFPIPGASAPLTALVGSGLGHDDFRFCGFLPHKQKARQNRLQGVRHCESTLIFFESPGRLKNALDDMVQILGGERKVVVGRELTKMHETFYRGSLAEVYENFAAHEKIRGEIVIVVSAAEKKEFSLADADLLLVDALKTMKTRQACAHVAAISGLSRKVLYDRALSLQKERPIQRENNNGA